MEYGFVSSPWLPERVNAQRCLRLVLCAPSCVSPRSVRSTINTLDAARNGRKIHKRAQGGARVVDCRRCGRQRAKHDVVLVANRNRQWPR